jgi:hypothetical protein
MYEYLMNQGYHKGDRKIMTMTVSTLYDANYATSTIRLNTCQYSIRENEG